MDPDDRKPTDDDEQTPTDEAAPEQPPFLSYREAWEYDHPRD